MNMNPSTAAPISVKAARLLFMVNAAIWLLFGVTSLVTMAADPSGPRTTLFVVGILMFGNAGAMAMAGYGIGRERRLFYY